MIKKANILIVDDLPENLKLLTQLIKGYGYYVRPVTSGQSALIAAQAIPPDLILLDINMPIMNGFETCEKLKANDKTQDIPIIFLSANTEPETIVEGFNKGAVDYITKPFQASEVLARIKTQLEIKSAREMILKQNYLQQELLHILCHDLLNSVGGAKVLLEIKALETTFSEDEEVILTSLTNAVDVIGFVKELRLLDEHKTAIKLAEFNLKKLIDEAVLIVNMKFEDKKIELIIDVSADLVIVVEKISFINSVLNNLLTNAIKFSFQQSIVKISAQQLDKKLRLSIKDFGIGMPKNLCDDIFKIEKVTTRKGTAGELGTGFGMPLVKKFVLAYQGEIEVFSQEKNPENVSHGTEIILLLKSEQ